MTNNRLHNAILGLNCFNDQRGPVVGMEFDGQDERDSFILTSEEKFTDPHLFRRNWYRRWRHTTDERRGECFGSIFHHVADEPTDMTNVAGDFNKDDEAMFLAMELETKSFTDACNEARFYARRQFNAKPRLILAKSGRSVLPLLPKTRK